MAFEYAVALTGGIATGKSTVAKFFSFFGFTVIDADNIAHEVLDQQYKAVGKLFGDEVIKNKKVKRKKLGKIVFKDEKKRKELEALVHPLIYEEIERLSEAEDRLVKPYLIDIPLFFETKRYPIEKSLLVYTDKKTQIKRLMHREGYSKKDAKRRIDSQLDIEKKRKKSDYIIDNMDDLNHLKNECERVKEMILQEIR
ncbi:MAG TPA: dephospho-CoA kinase [Sulfurovum sp.]|nr:dephospho-CoA kinase [Sulfurovum sp.]